MPHKLLCKDTHLWIVEPLDLGGCLGSLYKHHVLCACVGWLSAELCLLRLGCLLRCGVTLSEPAMLWLFSLNVLHYVNSNSGYTHETKTMYLMSSQAYVVYNAEFLCKASAQVSSEMPCAELGTGNQSA